MISMSHTKGFFSAVVVFTLLATVGCAPKFRASGQLRDLAYDSSAKNIALLFGAPNGLPGIDRDLASVKSVLEDPRAGNSFEVRVINEATKEKILEATRDAAIKVGQNGTLFWYFSGHGAESGTLMTIGGMLNFSEVTDVIKSSRETPVKRMFAFFDSCFSGQMVDGSATVKSGQGASFGLQGDDSTFLKQVAESYAQTAADSFHDNSAVAVMAPNAYEQLIVMSAAQNNQTSLATSGGSIFTNAVANVFRNFKSSKPNATIGDFLNGVTDETKESSGGHHTPAYRVLPEQGVMSESLFKTGGSSQNQAPPQSNQNGPQPDANGGDIQPQQQSGPARLVVGLGRTNAENGSVRLYVLTGAPVASVGLCSGTKEVCQANPQVFLNFRSAQQQTVFPRVPAGGLVLEAAKPLILEAGKPVTFLGFDASGAVVTVRTVRFRK